MIRLIIIIFLVIPFEELFGQNKNSVMDSLELVVKQHLQKDTNRINSLIQLEKAYYNRSVEKFGRHIDELKSESFALNYNYGISSAYFLSSYREQINGNFLKALDEIFKAIDYAQKENNHALLAVYYGQLATVINQNPNFSKNKFNDKSSLEYVSLGLENARLAKDPIILHKLLIRSVLINVDYGRIAEARELLEHCKTNYQKVTSKDYYFDILLQEGSISIQEKKYGQALANLFKAKAFAETDSHASFLGLIHYHIASAYFKMGKLQIAEAYYKDALNQYKVASPHIQLEIFLSLKELYQQTNNFKESLRFANFYYNLKDSLGKISTSHDFNELMIKYNLAIKENENIELKLQNLDKEKNLKITILVVFSLVIGFAVLGFLYQKLLKTKRKLATLNNKLEQSNKNKDIIFRIVSHDLKVPVNNLLIMTKKLEKSLDDLNIHVIRDYSHKINITAIHAVETVGNLLYWSNKEVGNAAVLEDVFVHDCIHDVLDTFQIYCKLLHKSIQFECKDKDLAIRMNRVQFSTLLKNLISNAIKYSATENGKIVVEAYKLDNKILISIEDNGNGNAVEISSHFLHSESSVAGTHLSGMGFKICSAIVKNYSLQIVFEKSQVLNGLKIVLII